MDHHLPGVNGDQVLNALRADAGAASSTVIAIATTAEPDPAIHAQLRNAGFAQVLPKPLAGGSLREALRVLGIECLRALPTPALDDGAGLRASGSIGALTALRGLLVRELDTLTTEWTGLQDDALMARLHRLRASCGFCGALALQSAAVKLSDALRANDPGHVLAIRAEFGRALTVTREALGSM